MYTRDIITRKLCCEYLLELLYRNSNLDRHADRSKERRNSRHDKLPFFGGEIVTENTTSRAFLELAVRDIRAFTILKLATPPLSLFPYERALLLFVPLRIPERTFRRAVYGVNIAIVLTIRVIESTLRS